MDKNTTNNTSLYDVPRHVSASKRPSSGRSLTKETKTMAYNIKMCRYGVRIAMFTVEIAEYVWNVVKLQVLFIRQSHISCQLLINRCRQISKCICYRNSGGVIPV